MATSSTLSLLSALYSPPAVIVADASLAAQLPTLWPFLSHTLTNVRLAAATCLARVVAAKDAAGWAAAVAAAAAAACTDGDAAGEAAAGATESSSGGWLQPVVAPCLRVLLQALVLERVDAVQQMLLQAWRALLQHSRAADIAAGLAVRDMRAMLTLLCTPCGQAVDASALVVPLQRRLVPWSSPEAEAAGLVARPAKRARPDPAAANGGAGGGLGSSGGSQGSLGAARGSGSAGVVGCAVDPEGWPGLSDPAAAVHMRLLASRGIAELCDKLTGQVST